jgi:uncharacterized protein involved in response to NO
MSPPRLLTEGFRVFFLAAALWAVFAVGIWEGWLAVHALDGMVATTPFAQAPYLWHAHEMVFGFATAVLGGFFLTAVPNWTGAPAARSLFVSVAAGLWLAGRLAVWWSGAIEPWLVAALDLAFLPVLAWKITLQLLKRPKPQNMMLLGILAAIWGGNLLCHLEWTGLVADGVGPGLRLGLGATCALIAVVGGRVTPAFTRNAMRGAGQEDRLPDSRPWLEAPAIAGAMVLSLLWAAGAPGWLLAPLGLATGAAQIGRVAGWRPGWTAGRPILWSLHLGMAMLGLGWLALAAHWAGAPVGETAALHLLGIGAVGGMTLAVMSRAALGHTGRPLEVDPAVAVAYALIAAAALARFAGPTIDPGWYEAALLVSGALWILGWAVFAALYAPILLGPKLGRGAA